MPQEKRSCYHCQFQSICFLKKRIDDALTGAWMVCLIAGEGAPKTFTALFDTLGEICTGFEKCRDEPTTEPTE